MEKQEKIFLVILVLLYLLTRLPLLTYVPFLNDEALYTTMSLEQAAHPTMIPTFYGFPIGWKPTIFFWVYGAFTSILFWLPLPLEVIFKLPTLVFGLANVFLVYYLTKMLTSDNKLAFLTTLIHTGAMLVVYCNTSVLIDTFNMTLILAGLYCYLNVGWNDRRFIAGAAFAFLSFFTKFWIAGMVPFLALAFFIIHDRKTLSNRAFLFSLLAIPLAYALFSLFFTQGVFQQDSSIAYTIANRMLSSPMSLENKFCNSCDMFLVLTNVWFGLSLFGAARFFKKNLFMVVWFGIIIFAIMAGHFSQIWYYLYAMVPIAYFSAKALLEYCGKPKLNRLCILLTAILLIANTIYGFTYFTRMYDMYYNERMAGELVAGKENVLIIGGYCPSIAAYKTLNEEKSAGRSLDFGWILLSRVNNDSVLHEYIGNYNSDKYAIMDGSFAEMFDVPIFPGEFRKPSNMTKPDYVVICGFRNVSAGTLIMNESDVRVFKSAN